MEEMKKKNGSNVVCVNLGKDYHIDGQNTQLSLFEKNPSGGGKITP